MEQITQAEFDGMTPEQRESYQIARYKERTDNNIALGRLRAHIEEARANRWNVWPTGFDLLDKQLDGGFMGGQLIFLGAISSLGKTSFALQAAAQMIEQAASMGQERDVLIFSLEMSADELNAKLISRYTHILVENKIREMKGKGGELRQYKMTTRDILTGRIGRIGDNSDDKGKLFLAAYERAKKISDHIRIFVGENDIDVDLVDEAVRLHIKATGRKPFVILDYLQILRPSDQAQTTDKRLLTDYDVTRLKVIARDHDIPVFAVSAFNRNSYLESVSMGSFRESSGIEYSSDVLLGAQYQNMDYLKHWMKNKDTGRARLVYEAKQSHEMRIRDLMDENAKRGNDGLGVYVELKILKNRNGGKETLYYEFLPKYNHYSEMLEGKKVNPNSVDWVAYDGEEWDDAEDVSSVVSCKGGGMSDAEKAMYTE